MQQILDLTENIMTFVKSGSRVMVLYQWEVDTLAAV